MDGVLRALLIVCLIAALATQRQKKRDAVDAPEAEPDREASHDSDC
jgi:hypothetical protein